VRSWSFDRLGVETTEVLERFTAETDFFDTGAVARVLAEKRGPQGWYLLNFALWWQRYVAA